MGYGMAGPNGKIGNKIPKGTGVGQIQQFTPEQMKLFGEMFSNVSPDSFTGKLAGGDQEMFNQLEAPALKQFAGLQGGLASRFSGMGQGGRLGSGFKNAANQQTSDFSQQLQSNRMGLQRQAIQDLMGMSNSLLNQRPYETFTYEKQQKPGIGGYIGAGLGAAGGFFAGGPAGALQGASLGYNLGSGQGFGGSGGGSSGQNFGSIFNGQSIANNTGGMFGPLSMGI